MFKQLTSLLICIALTGMAYGQGTVRGTVKDGETQEPIFNALIKVQGQSKGARTDFDGEFELVIGAGTYNLLISNKNGGYIDKIEEVIVVNGEILVKNFTLSTTEEMKAADKEAVIVVGNRVEGAPTVEADDKRRQNEKGATDGVTSEQMVEKGVSTAIEAVQSAPGLSVEDGKSVYIRGLGDRYTKTILNGMEIPGLDPDRNSVQMDIFPAAVIDNITVYKTFVPNLAGDFTGGLVDITTKAFPSERTVYAKVGLGYNSMATFNSDYISYNGGKLDFLGFDDGTRALPVRATDKFPNPVLDDPILEERTRLFNKEMAASQASNFLNQSYSFGYGDRISFKRKPKVEGGDSSKWTYGYNAVVNYRNSHRFYEDVEYSEYRLESTAGVPQNELEKSRISRGNQSENNVLWTALVGQSLKFNKTSLKLSLFHTQNGTSSAAVLQEENFEDNPSTLEKTSLQYTQRSVSNVNLSGRHILDTNNRWKLEWKLSPTYSLIKDPDVRSTALAYELDSNGAPMYSFDPAVGAQTVRIWRELNEYNLGGRVDMTYTWDIDSSRKSELAFGGLNTYKHRYFSIMQYLFDFRNAGGVDFSGDPNWYFEDENIWTVESDTGLYVNAPEGAFEPANQFEASQNVMGAYVMNEFPFTENFRATYGARVENAKNWYTGQNNQGTEVFLYELILDEWSILPSANLVYKIEKPADTAHYKRFTNLRAAYSKTVARPSFKEKSLSQIYDPLQGRTFNGNIDLQQTDIHNFDFRWEYFFGRTELISASTFYKQFYNPIELVIYNTAPNNVQPLNTGTAQVYGAEVEVRKAIGFNKKEKEHLSFVVGANYTYVVSKVNMNESFINAGGTVKSEKQIREENARVGETISDFRPLYGQSPYIINAFTTFRNDSLGLTINASYNVQGKKLAVIGMGRIPDVYEQPFHSLNFKVSKSLGKEENWKASLTGKNLLMSTRRKMYESFNATSQLYSYFNPGMTITASVAYNLSGKRNKKTPETKTTEK